MVETFNLTFGQDERDNEDWGRMCVLVGMQNIPESLEARRQVYTQRSSFSFLMSALLRTFASSRARPVLYLVPYLRGYELMGHITTGHDRHAC